MEIEGDVVTFPDPVEARLSAVWDGKVFKVQGKVSGKAELHCALCLEPFSLPFEAPYEEIFRPAGTEASPEEEAHALEGKSLDLLETIRLNILLELPMRAICSPGCRGLCQSCGVNLNVAPCGCREQVPDSPFAALQGLLEVKNPEKPWREG